MVFTHAVLLPWSKLISYCASSHCIQRRKAEEEARKEADFQKSYAEVLAGLSNESGIMGDTQYTLMHKAKIKANKQSELHSEWNKEVFEKIQGRLQREVSQRSHKSISARLKVRAGGMQKRRVCVKLRTCGLFCALARP